MAAFMDNKLIARPYTPVRPVLGREDNGEIQFIIKVYFPQVLSFINCYYCCY